MAEEKERMMLRGIENAVRDKMAERNDYQAYYYKPVIGKYHRVSKQEVEDMHTISGDQ